MELPVWHRYSLVKLSLVQSPNRINHTHARTVYVPGKCVPARAAARETPEVGDLRAADVLLVPRGLEA